jgi:hypothetical protein
MLGLSATLLAAQKQFNVDPRVTVTIGDVPPESVRLSELATIYRGTEGDQSFDAALALARGAIGRVRCDPAGIVWAQTVDTPANGPWDVWQQVATGAYANSPVAMGFFSDGVWRVFYVGADGHSIYSANLVDGSSAWGAPYLAVDAGAGFLVTGIATDAQGVEGWIRIFFVVSGGQLFESHWGGSAWTAPLGDGGAYVGAPTVTAGYRPVNAPHGDGDDFVLVAHGNPSTVILRTFQTASNTWGPSTTTLLQAGLNSGYSYAYPRLAETRSDQLRQCITWVETAPAPIGAVPRICWTPTHLALPSPVPFAGPFISSGQAITRGFRAFKDQGSPSSWWFVHSALVYRAPADSASATTGQRVSFAMADIVDFRIEQAEPNRPAAIQVTVLNASGALAMAGQAGGYLGLRQWSQLALSVGYHTSAGDETVWQMPCWIESIVFRDDVATGQPLVTFFCTDAWGILDRLVCGSSVTFTNATLDTILSWIWWHVCGDLNLSPPASLSSITLAEFVIRAGESYGDAARRVCDRAGVVLRFRTLPTSADGVGWDSVGQTVVSWGTGGSTYSYGPGAGQHPIVQGNLAPLVVPSATSAEVVGKSTTSLARNWSALQLLGHEVLTRLVDKTLDTQAKTDSAAANLASLLGPETRGGEITALANVGIEIGDQVDVTIASAGVSAQVYTVAAVVTSWDREHGLIQTLGLEGSN